MIRSAEARLAASIMINSSIRWLFTGRESGWMMNTSCPRTDSWISQQISPSENVETLALPKGMRMWRAIPAASSGLALPVNTLIEDLCWFIRTRRLSYSLYHCMPIPRACQAKSYNRFRNPAKILLRASMHRTANRKTIDRFRQYGIIRA